MMPNMKVDSLVHKYQTKLVENGFIGEIHLDTPTRLLNATDNSIYELMPQAVIQPRHAVDVERMLALANQAEFKTLCFAPRGGGTGTNGQSLSHKIVIDFSRFMTNILDFNPNEQTVTVEPGIILTDLNRYLQPHGLFFAPHVSTADRATIGGMIATDAAGKGSLIYGKTADHVLGLKLVLANGNTIDTEKVTIDKLDKMVKVNDAVGLLYKRIVDLLDPVQDEITKRFPPLKRPLSGYNIKQAYTDGEFDLTKIISGSEGTLGIVTRAKLKLLPIPKHKALIVIHYDSFNAALKDAQFLIRYKPLAIEAVDEKVQKSAQTLPNWPSLARMLNSVDKNYISNFMEFVADTSVELTRNLSELRNDLDKKNANYVVITDHSQINQLWSIRSLAVGLVGKMPGVRKPIAFVEDAIVPPEHLADFVADLHDYLASENLNYSMYGHVDVGCIHVRPALNMQDEEDRQKIRPITEMVIKLLDKYQGVLWGEHGKGFRGEFVPDVFGPVLYPVLCKIKALFDPTNRLNPGKLASPDAVKIKLDRIELVPMRGQLDQVISPAEQAKYAGALLCNGNAACFNQEPSNVMCPSYKVTKDRVHSPKGRAMMVKEWLRVKANGGNHRELAKQTLEAMQGCLGCKGCVGKCPTQVSIPDLRTSFLNNYHKQYKGRTIREKVLGYIEHILPVAAKYPKTWNFVTGLKFIPTLGMSSIPKFSLSVPLSDELSKQKVHIYSEPEQVVQFKPNPMVIFADAFTSFMDHDVLFSVINTARALGYTPYVIYPRASGKSLIVGGFVSKFKRNSAKLNKLFAPLFSTNIPVVALENTVTLMFRDEVNKFAKPFEGKVLTIAEFISSNQEKLEGLGLHLEGKYQLLPHCTEQAIQPGEAILWKTIFSKCSSSLDVQNVGCCGMAGTYGYQDEHKQNSQQLFAMHWEKPLANAAKSDTKVLATGFSCRCQTEKIAAQTVLHPIQIIAKQLNI